MDLPKVVQSPQWGLKLMPIEKAKTRAQLIKEISKALKEAEGAGVTDVLELVKKIPESKHRYITWKYKLKR